MFNSGGSKIFSGDLPEHLRTCVCSSSRLLFDVGRLRCVILIRAIQVIKVCVLQPLGKNIFIYMKTYVLVDGLEIEDWRFPGGLPENLRTCVCSSSQLLFNVERLCCVILIRVIHRGTSSVVGGAPVGA